MSLQFDEKLSALKKPERDEMTDAQYERFNSITTMQEESWGFINNLFKVLPVNPTQYEGFLDFKHSLFNPELCHLSNADKEMIGLVVSAANGCAYCLTTHSHALRLLTGKTEWVDQITYNYRTAELTDKQRALCDYAFFVTVYPREIDTDLVDKLRAVGFNDNEVLEAAYVAGFFNYTNRWVSTIKPKPNDGHYNHAR